jgi:hypothetical protein
MSNDVADSTCSKDTAYYDGMETAKRLVLFEE